MNPKKKKKAGKQTANLHQLIHTYGSDILHSDNFKKSDKHIQHGNISVMKHSIRVAKTSLALSRKLHLKVSEKDLVRGALLHDYFGYDWHGKKVGLHEILHFYEMHGFTHPSTALKNAEKEYRLTGRQRDIIQKHMWPLTIKPPACREAWIVTMADKYCSLMETLRIHRDHSK
ncbi:MAG: HD domain-containing protein [Lachnospiraceae bacterium]|nr:HD domain-containing protein [Lachnospiraceae bacterium]